MAFDTTALRHTCAYCNTKYKLSFCNCECVVCDTHLPIHSFRGHKIVFLVENGNVVSLTLSGTECNEIALQLRARSDTETIESVEVCAHLKEMKGEVYKGDKCNECEIKTNLWICYECGYTGCPRQQYGLEGNGHAEQHFKESGHCISVMLESIDKWGDNDSYCYVCDKFIKNPFVGGRIVTEKIERKKFENIGKEDEWTSGSEIECFDAEGNVHLTRSTITKAEKIEKERIKKLLVGFIGIKNYGNTCYLSSVLQMISLVVDIDEDHFFNCHLDPLSCLNCQTIRVIKTIKMGRDPPNFERIKINRFLENKEEIVDISGEKKVTGECHSGKNTITVPIVDFIRLVYSNFSFKPNEQQDASEFLHFFMNHVDQNAFQFEINYIAECSCGLKKRRIDRGLFITTGFAKSVSDAVSSYLKPSEIDCECGLTVKSTPYFRILPRALIVVINRAFDSCNKINDSIKTDDFAIINHLTIIPSADGIERLMSAGFGYDESCDALKISDNNVEVAVETLITGKAKLRTDTMYRFKAAVCHKGRSTLTGHYSCIVKLNDVFVHIDDEKVKVADERDLETAYIVLYE